MHAYILAGQWPSSSSSSSINKQDKSSTLNQAVDEHSGTNTAYSSPHLGLAFGYPYSAAPSVGTAPPTTTATATSTAFSNSYGFTSNSGGCSEWPDLSASANSSGAQQKTSSAHGSTWDNSALSSTATTTATTSKGTFRVCVCVCVCVYYVCAHV